MASMVPETEIPRPNILRRMVNGIIATAIGMVMMIIIGDVTIRIAFPRWSEFDSQRFMSIVNVPGYGSLGVGKAGFDGYFAQNNGDFRTHVRINAFGLRETDPIEAADGQIWVVGDSMAFGWGVEEEETYASRIEKALGTDVYNLAAPGNDICGYRKMIARVPPNLKPKAVIVGLILENDIKAYNCDAEFSRSGKTMDPPKVEPPEASLVDFSLSKVKSFLIGYSALYSFLASALKKIEAVNSILVNAGIIAPVHAYRALPTGKAMDRALSGVASELGKLRRSLPEETPFAVLVAPTRFEIKSNDPDHRALRLATIDALSGMGIPAIDPIDSFARAGFGAVHFEHDGHWSKVGHELAAKEVANWLLRHLSVD